MIDLYCDVMRSIMMVTVSKCHSGLQQCLVKGLTVYPFCHSVLRTQLGPVSTINKASNIQMYFQNINLP